jgi:hypothetical protein
MFFVNSSYLNGLVLEARLNQVGMLMAVLIRIRTAEHDSSIFLLCESTFSDILQVQVSDAASMANDVLPTIKPAEWCATQLYFLQICCVAELAQSRFAETPSAGAKEASRKNTGVCFNYCRFCFFLAPAPKGSICLQSERCFPLRHGRRMTRRRRICRFFAVKWKESAETFHILAHSCRMQAGGLVLQNGESLTLAGETSKHSDSLVTFAHPQKYSN